MGLWGLQCAIWPVVGYVLASLAFVGSGCAGPNLFTDLTSVSTGSTNQGRVRQPARLSSRGRGFRIPDRWRERGFRYGVDELVQAVTRAAETIRGPNHRVVLGVADLSPRGGGPSPWHRSHQSGRDMDLLFYTRNRRGRPLPPPERDMIRFAGSGEPLPPEREDAAYTDPKWRERRFDDRRNWRLVEELLRDDAIRVQFIFVSNALKLRLLRQARRTGAEPWVMALAEQVLRQPGPTIPHDNHFHVRIYCSRADRFHGCRDTGPIWRHEKKAYKYYGPERYDPWLWRVALLSRGRAFH